MSDSRAQLRLPTLQRESLRDRTMEVIRDAITLGTIKPGTHLVETQLATDLGISRGTLREALRHLQQAGLVVESPNGRLSVLELTPELIHSTYQARALVEAAAATLLMRRADLTELLPELERRLAVLAATDDQTAVLAAIEADLDFHRGICQLAGNDVLLGKWEEIALITRMTILNAGPEAARTNMAAARHQPILTAIASGEIELVFETLYEHTMSAVSRILGGNNTDARQRPAGEA